MSFESHISTTSAGGQPPLEQRLMAAFGRFAGGLLLLVVAALWLSVMTWSVTDPSLTHATSGTPRNLMGALGAIVSDLLLQTLGLAALVVLIAPLFWGLAMLRNSETAGLAKSQLFWFPIAALMTAGALSALPVLASWPLHHGFGGIIGDTVFAMLANLFEIINAARGGLAAGLVLAAAGAASFRRAIGVKSSELFGAVLGGKDVLRSMEAEEMSSDAMEHDHGYARDPAHAPMLPFVDPAGRVEPHLMVPPKFSARRRDDSIQPHPLPEAVPRSGADTARLGDRFARAIATARGAAHRGVAAAHGQAKRIGASLKDTAERRRIAQQNAGAPVQPYRSPGYPHPPYGHGQAAAQVHGIRGDAADPFGVVAERQGASGYCRPYGLAPQGQGSPYDPADFDMTTEEASREIARRFAPQGAVAAQSEDLQAFVPAPQPMQQPHPHAQGHGRQTGGIHRAVASEGPAAAPAQPMSVPTAPRNAAGEAHAAPAPGRRNALFGGLQFRHQNQAARKLPPLNLLKKPVASKAGPEFTQTMLRGNARLLEDVLSDFGVKGEIRDIRPGPVVTLFEFEPARGVKSSRVIGLADDIARSMSATSARVAVVPGRNAIGIELPNTRRDSVLLREVLESEAYKAVDSALPIALGKSIGGEPVVADLARMPHLLVAGTTGSGKSVGVNAMIVSLLYRMSPDDCRFLMIDPKMLELSVYNGIPHLLAPVVTDPQKAVSALNWVVGEMEERYKRMSKLSVRNIDVYNNRVRNAKKRGEMISRTVQTGFDRRTGEAVYEQEQMQLEAMPYIVVVIDEFADLMMVAGKDVEASVQRLAQMARAAGIHIIMATQRPSVDVITGTIKANFPTRISFKVTSKIDSRTILNEQGAEQLLGQGDMLFAAGSGQIGRVHGAFVADEEVEAITNFLRSQGAPRYVDGITDGSDDAPSDVQLPQGQGEEDLYDRAVAIILRDRKASTSYLQRRLSIGYNRAADLIERMEAEGLISAANHAGKREILAQAGGSASETSATAA